MSTISSKQEKRHALVDPVYVLVFLVLILALFVLGPLAGHTSNPLSSILGAVRSAPGSVPNNNDLSLAADRQYWESNCSRGWSSDSTCDAIVRRVQSCSISTASAYCSEYELYLQQVRNR